MNCECCHTPMIWIGSMSRGGMDCPRCASERPVMIDMGRGIEVTASPERVVDLCTVWVATLTGKGRGEVHMCGSAGRLISTWAEELMRVASLRPSLMRFMEQEWGLK